MGNGSTARHSATSSTRSQFGGDVLVGRVFNNRFRIQSLIARGGMGKVYRAIQLPLGRTVALKVLSPGYTRDQAEDFHRRFFLEAAVAARLTHPNTVTVFDFGCSDDGIYYIAMEYLEGRSLRAALAQERRFPVPRALHIAEQIARAVREAHQLGAAHRDLKPANVFLLSGDGTDDRVKVLDFGLVKQVSAVRDAITRPGKFLGSPGYMAPEQIRGRAMDTRCDIYALGVLLYEMLSGCPPFLRSNPLETMRAHVREPVPSLRRAAPHLKITERLEQLVQTCLAKEPAERYATMGDVLAALSALQSEVQAPLYGGAGVTLTPAAAARIVPEPMGDEEASGWTVVSSTGILARPRRPISASPTPYVSSSPSSEQSDTLAMTDASARASLDAPRSPRTTPVILVAPPPVATTTPSRTRSPRSKLGRHRRPAKVSTRRTWGAGFLLAMVALATALADGGHGRPAVATPWTGVTLKLTSTPPGATVLWGDTILCEQTPCQLRWEGDEAVPGRGVNLRFVLDGYDEFVASRVISTPELVVNSTLHSRLRGSRGP